MTAFTDTIVENTTATDKTSGTAFYWHPYDRSRHLELRSVHDVLTEREALSDPTGRHDLLRSQPIRKPPWSCS
jgi:hypothetical protein